MNVKPLLIAALVAVGGTAFAQEATPEPAKAQSLMSRADVAAELAQARKDGTSKAVSAGYDFSGRQASTKSRAEMNAEVIAARKSGELADINAEVASTAAVRTGSFSAASYAAK